MGWAFSGVHTYAWSTLVVRNGGNDVVDVDGDVVGMDDADVRAVVVHVACEDDVFDDDVKKEVVMTWDGGDAVHQAAVH